ncbi:MAG: coaE operon protein [Halobellus sp.]|uniref:coaE operon protein n=1 Tax=Halobellus sp. TaxID=1979212 RepID=UPI0035D4740F
MIYRIDARVVAPVRDTEVTARVEDAVRNLFPNVEFERREAALVGTTHSLERFSERLHEQEILDTARREFGKHADTDGFSFALKKQAAFKSTINFAVGNPDELGDIEIHVTVHEPDVESYIDYVAPPTEDGKPVDFDDSA